MRKSLALLSVVLAVLVLATGCKNKPPEIPAMPAGPDSVPPGVSATYRTWTTDPNKDDIRYVFSWGDAAMDTSGYLPSGDTASAAHAWDMVGAYEVKAKAQDENGNWSADWSDVHMVYVDSGAPIPNQPPNAPAKPEGPDNGLVGNWMTFTTSATDPDGDSVQIKFFWDEGQSSLWSAMVAGGETVTDSVMYQSRGLKNIKAIAMDSKGDVSDTSEIKEFYADEENVRPGKPVVTGPARGIKSGPRYRFYAVAHDPNSNDSLYYMFFWGDGSSATTPLYPNDVKAMDSTRYDTEGAKTIRAVAFDQFGAMSDTSDPFTFSVVGEGAILWSYNLNDDAFASPALGDVSTMYGDRLGVIMGVTNGTVVAVDAWQGEELYTLTESDEGFNSSASVGSGNAVYLGHADGNVYRLDDEGERTWRYPDSVGTNDIPTTPAVDGNAVYVGSEGGWVMKLTDGGASATKVWSTMLADEVISSPVLAGGKVIVCDDSGYVYALDPSTGAITGSFMTNSEITASPAIGTGGNVYVGTLQGKFFALNPGCTDTLWTYEIVPFTSIYGSAVVDGDGYVIFGADNGFLYKLDGATGQSAANWPVNMTQGGVAASPLLCADGIIYAQSDDDKLYALNPNGSMWWTNPVDLVGFYGGKRGGRVRGFGIDDVTPSPVVDQYGIIYVASTNDVLFAVAGRAAGTLATSTWPMFQHDKKHTGKAGSW